MSVERDTGAGVALLCRLGLELRAICISTPFFCFLSVPQEAHPVQTAGKDPGKLNRRELLQTMWLFYLKKKKKKLLLTSSHADKAQAGPSC
jgi:hypothetical protein